MSELRKISPEKIEIKEFRLVNGQVDSPYEFRSENISSFKFNVDLTAGLNIPESLIRTDIKIKVETVSKEPGSIEATGTYHFVFVYFYEGLNDVAKIEPDGKINWHPYLANAIASITYSTSRGILLSRFQGTVMRDFMMPVVDPNNLFLPSQENMLK